MLNKVEIHWSPSSFNILGVKEPEIKGNLLFQSLSQPTIITTVNGYRRVLRSCELCPRRCRAERLGGKRGFCGVGGEVVVSHYGPHFGEEPPITGTHGSGNIFFTSCNLRCIFCQNYQISHGGAGRPVTVERLVEIFFELLRAGVHNINLVSPVPYIPFIAEAIEKARADGFSLPFVYNTNAYENVDALRMLDGLIDIYLPDFKYWSGTVAGRLSGAGDYPEHARAAIAEMKRQVGDLSIRDGVAEKGILIRHLLLPGNLSSPRQVLRWIKETLGNGTHVSLMSQYNPLYMAERYPLLKRRIRNEEYDAVVAFLLEEGFENVFIQELESAPLFVPDFERKEPFRESNVREG
jgi:putative pyruvate formate lyase activating enzyme